MGALLLVQMSGVPGAGKSTVAQAIAAHCGTVILDHDLTKSALLDTGVSWDDAGRGSYHVLFALARSLLEQEQSVVIDSPCLYQNLLDQGLRLAQETRACYRYVECVVDDLAEIDRRLRTRRALRSQRTGLTTASGDLAASEALSGEALFRYWQQQMRRPTHSYLRLDTARPLAESLPELHAFLTGCADDHAVSRRSASS